MLEKIREPMRSDTTILPVRPVEKRVAVVPDVGIHNHVQAHYVEAHAKEVNGNHDAFLEMCNLTDRRGGSATRGHPACRNCK